jgi:hypothetical protein
MKAITGLLMLIAVFALCARPVYPQGTERFLGVWVVDYDQTMEEAKKSPKYQAKDAPLIAGMIKRMMATMKIEFTRNEMIYLRGDRKNAIPYTVKSGGGSKTTLSCTAGGRQFEVVVTLREGTTMNFKSSGSDDMDFYIWKRGR